MTSTAQSPQKGVSFAKLDSGDSSFLRTPSVPQRETGEKVMARLDYDQPFRPATVQQINMEYYPLLVWEKSSNPPDDDNVARIASRYYTTEQRSPRNMTDNYPLLANRLTSQTEFTQEEWDELGIKDMKLLDYICADKFYFQPSPPSGRIIAVRWDQQQDNSKKFDEPPNQVNLSAEHVRGLHIEVQARDQASNERMRLGGIVFSWEEGQHLKRVPYFIVPDGWAKESSFVDMVIQGMKLKTPNMVLNFNPIKEPISRWNKEWDYSSADRISQVDKGALPLEVPAGQSMSAEEVAKYMASVVEDRVLDIVGGVAQACTQARAWMQVTRRPGEAGMYDFAPQLLSQAADKNSVIVGTYCMEDFVTAVDAGTPLDQTTFGCTDEGTTDTEQDPGDKIKEVVVGSKAFCQSLHKYAGNPGDPDPNQRPKEFLEEIDDVMETFARAQKQTVKPVRLKNKNGSFKKNKNGEYKMGKRPQSCIEKLNNFFEPKSGRAYLPPKDISHLLVFQSRLAADTFQTMLEARVSICNFIMAGSVEAMDKFDVSMKTGRPVFVLHGTGGAADMIDLVLSHMEFRKQLSSKKDKREEESDEDNMKVTKKKAEKGGGFKFGLPGFKGSAKVAPLSSSQMQAAAGPGKNDTIDSAYKTAMMVAEPGGLKDLEDKIERGLVKFREETENKELDLFQQVNKQSGILWLTKLRNNTDGLKLRFQKLLSSSEVETSTAQETTMALTEELKQMHNEVDLICGGVVDKEKVRQHLEFVQSDANSDGYVSLPELRARMKTLNPYVSEQEIQEKFKEMDIQNLRGDPYADGKVTKGEFQAAHLAEGTPATNDVSVSASHVLREFYVKKDTAAEVEEEEEEAPAPRPTEGGTPEDLYYWEAKVGRAGIEFEALLGCEYLGTEQWRYEHVNKKGRYGRLKKKWEQMEKMIQEMPPDWKLPFESAPHCMRGFDGSDRLTRAPCGKEDCPECSRAKNKERQWLRKVGRNAKPWEKLSDEMQTKYLEFWMSEHPLTHNDRMALDPQRKIVAKMARTTFTNVYEPPIDDACVRIDILQKELNIEQIMDNVTSAMSIDALMNEVGEKKAFRQRLLIAWQMVNQLNYNANIQAFRNNVFNILIIIFSFLSVLVGTLTYSFGQLVDLSAISGDEPLVFGVRVPNPDLVLQVTTIVNIILPMMTSLFMAMNSAFSPGSKYTALYHQALFVESEIFKVRTRVGDYDPVAAAAAASTAGPKDAAKGGDSEAKGDKKDGKKGGGVAGNSQMKNPRQLFAERVDAVWTDLGASEVRQESLRKPPNNELVNLNKSIKVQEHPALFEEGDVLGNRGYVASKKVLQETLDKFSYHLEDDGLKVLSAQDYVDLRVAQFESVWTNRAERLCLQHQVLQLLVFILTSLTTLLGALGQMQWIPVALALGTVFSSTIAYRAVESRMENVNAANVSLRKHMVWWHGLSVIEKRIPANKTTLVNTMESIIQAEAGSVVMRHGEEDSGGGGGGGGGGAADGAGSGDK